MTDFITNFTLKNLGIYATVLVIFTYNILLNRDLTCSCKKQVTECGLYISLPVFIIFFLILWMDETFIKICRYSLSKCKCCYGCEVIYHITKAVCISALWLVTLLIDGDWFVCCSAVYNQTLACKDKRTLTQTEQTMMANLKNLSRVIGFGLFLFVILTVFLTSVFHQMKCCNRKWGKKYMYDYMILEEENNVLTEKLKAKVVKDLTQAFNGKTGRDRWMQYYDVAKELISQGEAAQEQEDSQSPEAQEPGSVSQPPEQQQQLKPQEEPPAGEAQLLLRKE